MLLKVNKIDNHAELGKNDQLFQGFSGRRPPHLKNFGRDGNRENGKMGPLFQNSTPSLGGKFRTPSLGKILPLLIPLL